MTEFTKESALRENLHRSLDNLRALIARLPESAEKRGLEAEMLQLSAALKAYRQHQRGAAAGNSKS